MTTLNGTISRAEPRLENTIVTALVRIPAGACPATGDLAVNMDAALDVVRRCFGEN